MNLLDIDKAKDEQRLISEEVNDTVMEHVMAGIEIISGKRGSQYFGVSTIELYFTICQQNVSFQQLLERIDEKYIMRWLCKESRNNDFLKVFEELALT